MKFYEGKPSSEVIEAYKSKALSLRISENYKGSDVNAANWDIIKIKDISTPTDFFITESDPIDLTKYAGKEINFALVFSPKKDQGFDVMWQINTLKILGAAYNTADLIRVRGFFYSHEFQFLSESEAVTGFSQYKNKDSAGEFKPKVHNNESYLNIDTFGDKNIGTNLLVTDPIELAGGSYSLQVKQAINFYKKSAKDNKMIQILVGANKAKVEDIEWEELEFNNVPSGDSWDPVESEWLELGLLNQEIRVGFRYQSGEPVSQDPNWSLYFLRIKEN